MENINILISVGVLQQYWEKGQNDTLELLMPFLKSSIAKICKIGDKIDISLLSAEFRKDYGYYDIPIDVITTMLKRLSPEIIKIENKNFYLHSSLEDEVKKFEQKRKQSKKNYEDTIKCLNLYIQNKMNRTFSNEEISNYLYDFFVQHGFCIANNTEDLVGISKKNNEISYEIANFILDEYKKESTIFDEILEIVKGFFVSTALSVGQANISMNTKLKGMSCYIDTRIIINALGYHLPEISQESARDFLAMLKEAGAKLYCFEHIVNEIKNVLSAYKNSLCNSNFDVTSNTLEALDERGYGPVDVDRLILELNRSINDLGIDIVKTPSIDSTNKQYITYNENELELVLKSISPSSSIQADETSVSSILLLRKGKIVENMERVEHIFISSNYRYCQAINQFLGEQIPIVYFENEFASLLWLRNFSTHKDYPKSKLIENAMSTIEVPSQTFVRDLQTTIERIKNEGSMSEEIASLIRADFYCKKELYIQSRGSSENVTISTIESLKAKLKEKIGGEESKKSALNLQKYNEQREINARIKRNAYETIEKVGKKKKKFVEIIAITISWIFCIIVMSCGSFIFVKDLLNDSINFYSIVICLLDIYAFVFQVLKHQSHLKRYIDRLSDNFADIAKDKKRKELQTIVEDLYN